MMHRNCLLIPALEVHLLTYFLTYFLLSVN